LATDSGAIAAMVPAFRVSGYTPYRDAIHRSADFESLSFHRPMHVTSEVVAAIISKEPATDMDDSKLCWYTGVRIGQPEQLNRTVLD